VSELKYTPGEDPAEAWMRDFASQVLNNSPIDNSALPDLQLLWWKAQALRRLDADNRAHATLERGEGIQVAFSIFAAIALFAVMLVVPSLWAASSLTKSSVLVAVSAAAFVGVGVLLATWRSRASADSAEPR
jgi:hypothetical protein